MMKHVFGRFWRVLALPTLWTAGLLLLAGCGTPGSGSSGGGGLAQATPVGGKEGGSSSSLESPDALRVGESLLIEFSGVGDPPPRHEERIKTDGHITLPSIGPIEAAGKTRGELEQAIHDKYVPSYYRQLTVIVRNEGRFFYVRGQVKNPNQFQYVKEMTVTKAIAAAGDFTDFAKKKDVRVIRANGRILKVNCIKALENAKLDVPIFPDDIIEVPRRYF
jgi:polysaccharide export outer membrane protein